MPVKAVALASSGLDSLLSAKIIRDQGIEVLALHCAFSFGEASGILRRQALEKAMDSIGVPLTVIDITEPFMNVMRRPEHGFGSAVNPCIDCHLFMLRTAKKRMEEIGASFVVTGEVVGQRPMSQNRPMLFHIEKHADLRRLIVRPLSAKLLPVTVPEERGWIRRDSMYAIGGRGRKAQVELAAQLGITGYFQPAGGCILTDPIYAKRVKTFIRCRGQENLTSESLSLCRHGRHFWLDGRLWIIAGRDEKDNNALASLAGKKWTFLPVDEKGPLVLADGIRNEADIAAAAGITARYSKNKVPVIARFEGRDRTIEPQPAREAFIEANRL
jgi:tRNA-specific 2-thiouridylase